MFARSLAEGLCATLQKLIIAALHKFIHVLTFIELHIKKSQFVTKFKNEINFKTERCSFFVSNAVFAIQSILSNKNTLEQLYLVLLR